MNEPLTEYQLEVAARELCRLQDVPDPSDVLLRATVDRLRRHCEIYDETLAALAAGQRAGKEGKE